jgi:hypothetical protein
MTHAGMCARLPAAILATVGAFLMRSIFSLHLMCSAVGLTLLLAGSAYAGCYEGLGCSDRDRFSFEDLADGPTCDLLWRMRNEIYKERGYCFRTQRGIAVFGNAGCQYDDVALVPLNAIERDNVATIGNVEHARRCPL